jgi:hypothetical protein
MKCVGRPAVEFKTPDKRRRAMVAWKYWDEKKVGEQVQNNYTILSRLFDEPGQKAFRDALFAYPTEAALRAALNTDGVIVDAGVRIMLVDIEYARTKTFGPINPATEDYYVLVLPPIPRRPTSDPTKADYKRDQAWEGAWHHAIVDGYGM